MANNPGQGDAFKRLSRGDKVNIVARSWNVLMEMGEKYAAKNGGGGSAGQVSPITRPNVVVIRNDSGGNLVAGNVLGISDVCFDYADEPNEFIAETQFAGITPTTASHAGKFAVLTEPIIDGESGQAVVYGICAAQVNIVTSGDKWCDVTNSDATKLTSGSTGSAQILFAPSGTGTKWCVIRIGGSASESLIPVSLTTDGGADGDQSTAPTYTYKWPVNYITAVEIKKADGSRQTGLGPLFARNIGTFNRATKGLVYMDANGDPQLLICDETEIVCTIAGASGTFTTVDGKTVTVESGIITDIT
jgi:hypothetical protein